MECPICGNKTLRIQVVQYEGKNAIVPSWPLDWCGCGFREYGKQRVRNLHHEWRVANPELDNFFAKEKMEILSTPEQMQDIIDCCEITRKTEYRFNPDKKKK